VNWYGIWTLEKLGLAKKILLAKVNTKLPEDEPKIEDKAPVAMPVSPSDLVSV
jgi:hypothetical protein